MRLKLYNTHTNRWVFLDGNSAKKYLQYISYQNIIPHPLAPEQFVSVIDADGREIPTPFPNPKSLADDDDDDADADGKAATAAVGRLDRLSTTDGDRKRARVRIDSSSADAHLPQRKKRVHFSPSAKKHDGLCPEMLFFENSAQMLFSKAPEDPREFVTCLDNFQKALQYITQSRRRKHKGEAEEVIVEFEVVHIMQAAVSAITRAHASAEPVFLMNTGSSTLMFDPANPRHTSALLVILQGCKIFIDAEKSSQRPLPFL